MDTLIGQKLDEYRLVAELGRGGMARVYLALDERRRHYAAVKVIETALRDEPVYVARFRREAQAIAQLDHPHIVRLYRYGEANGLLYIAMEYVEGVDLASLLASYRAEGALMPAAEAVGIAAEIASALDYAHSQGVIHRDVKPSNILIDRDGQAVLTDFGLVLLADIGTRGEAFGSAHYMAPEQAISSAGAVPQSDLYALGVILYEMFTGRVPYDVGTAVEVALAHVRQPLPTPRSVNPAIPPPIEAVILRALAKEPEARFANGAALAAALRQAIGVAPALEPQPTAPRLTLPDRVGLHLEERPAVVQAVVSRRQEAGGSDQSVMPPGVPPPIHGRRLEVTRRTPFLLAGCVVLFLVVSLLTAGSLWLSRTGRPGTGVAPGPTPSPATTEPQTPVAPLPSPTPSRTAFATPTATPTRTPTQTATPNPAPAAITYELLIAINGGNSLFVVNEGPDGFPLGPLQLHDGRGEILGGQWDVATLNTGECVAAWRGGRDREPPDVACEQVGRDVTRGGGNNFWRNAFDVFYEGEEVGRCEENDDDDEDQRECQLTITAR